MSDKKIFIIRAILWSLFAAVIPFVFIGWRYDLFKKAGSLQLSGWGMIGIIIVFIFIIALVKYIKAGFPEWSMLKQILNGVIKVLLPIGVLLALCMGIKSNIEYFTQALSLVLLSEAIAIPVNPFPKWVYEKSKGKFESMIDLFANKINNKKEE